MATSDEQRTPRFSIDHGIIHDRMSGKHLRTVLGDGPALDAEVHETLAELNQLDADAAHLATVIAEFIHKQVVAQQAPQERADDEKYLNYLLGDLECEPRDPLHNRAAKAIRKLLAERTAALAANPQQSNGAILDLVDGKAGGT